MIKQKAVVVCDYCGKDLKKSYLQVEDVPTEGCSTLTWNKKVYYVEESDFCDMVCFVAHVEKTFGGK